MPKPKTTPASSPNSPAALAAYLASRSSDAVFAIGPVVWRPSDGLAARQFYMTIATGDATGEAYFTEITLGAGPRPRQDARLDRLRAHAA